MFLPHPRVKVNIAGSLRDREVACLASDRQGWNFESCVWRTVSSQSSHHPQEVLLTQFSLYVHKGGLKPDSFHCLHNFSRIAVKISTSMKFRDTLKQVPKLQVSHEFSAMCKGPFTGRVVLTRTGDCYPDGVRSDRFRV